MFDSWSMTYIWRVAYDIIWHITYDILVSHYGMWETMTYGMRDMRCEMWDVRYYTWCIELWTLINDLYNYNLGSMIQDLWYVTCNMIPELPKLRCEDRRYIPWQIMVICFNNFQLIPFERFLPAHGKLCTWRFLPMVPRHETSGKKEKKKSGDAARVFLNK